MIDLFFCYYRLFVFIKKNSISSKATPIVALIGKQVLNDGLDVDRCRNGLSESSQYEVWYI